MCVSVKVFDRRPTSVSRKLFSVVDKYDLALYSLYANCEIVLHQRERKNTRTNNQADEEFRNKSRTTSTKHVQGQQSNHLILNDDEQHHHAATTTLSPTTSANTRSPHQLRLRRGSSASRLPGFQEGQCTANTDDLIHLTRLEHQLRVAQQIAEKERLKSRGLERKVRLLEDRIANMRTYFQEHCQERIEQQRRCQNLHGETPDRFSELEGGGHDEHLDHHNLLYYDAPPGGENGSSSPSKNIQVHLRSQTGAVEDQDGNEISSKEMAEHHGNMMHSLTSAE
ncbi:unnamed protein product, partial [Amoebophrya sp. A25]|eukprot:GSA25T00009012001.1